MAQEAAIRGPESKNRGLGFEETELKLAPPGSRSRVSGAPAVVETERKRGFSQTVDLSLSGTSAAQRGLDSGDPPADLTDSQRSVAVKPLAK